MGDTIRTQIIQANKTAYHYGLKTGRNVSTKEAIDLLAAEQCEKITEEVAIKFHDFVTYMPTNKRYKLLQGDNILLTTKELFQLFKEENKL